MEKDWQEMNSTSFKLFRGQARSYLGDKNIYTDEMAVWVSAADTVLQVVRQVRLLVPHQSAEPLLHPRIPHQPHRRQPHRPLRLVAFSECSGPFEILFWISAGVELIVFYWSAFGKYSSSYKFNLIS